MVLWFGRDEISSKWSIGDETNLFIVVVASTLAEDALKNVSASVVFDQLRVYELVSVTGVQTASNNK
jgi:hypothetical protein